MIYDELDTSTQFLKNGLDRRKGRRKPTDENLKGILISFSILKIELL